MNKRIVEHRSLTGALLSSFTVPFTGVSCLALDPADGTLWMGSQNTKGTFYQYSQAGTRLRTRTYGNLLGQNTLGGEFPPAPDAPPPPPPPTPTPTPTPIALVSVSVSGSPTQINEGSNSTFTFRASSPPAQAITLFYSMSGKAKQNSDYTLSGTTGQVTIPAHQSSATVTLHAVTDLVNEKNESAILQLQNAPAYSLSQPNQATVTIVNVPPGI